MSQTRGIIALTGATGFIGRHVLGRLLARGEVVRVLARDPARLPPLPDDAARRLHVVRGALEDEVALARLVAGARVVVHLAGVVKAPDAATFMRGNALASGRLAACAARAGVARFVHVSSLAARAPTLSTYARSKHESECILRDFADRFSLVMIRPPAVYGPGDEATFALVDQLSRAHAFIPGRREARFSLVHASDLARAVARLAFSDVQGVFELDDGHAGGYDWPRLAAIASRVLGREVRLHLLPRPLVTGAGMLADVMARLSGRAFMLGREKVNELYHDDWVARAPLLQRHLDWTPRLQFAEGFLDTLRHWCRAGRLPQSRLPAQGADREA